jgi:hypothetical protein
VKARRRKIRKRCQTPPIKAGEMSTALAGLLAKPQHAGTWPKSDTKTKPPGQKLNRVVQQIIDVRHSSKGKEVLA